MRIYHKQLNSLKELKEEKEMLKTSLGSANPTEDPVHKSAHSRQEGQNTNFASMLWSVLSNDVIFELLMRLGAPAAKKAGKFAGKNLFKIGKEVLGGYAKWKALEIGYRWTRLYLHRRKEKKERSGDHD